MESVPSEKKKVDGLFVYERRMKRSIFNNPTDENNRTIGDDGSYYVCVLCEDGGDLICCDSCPNTFHIECLKYESIPEGKWNCPNCQEAESLNNLKISKKAESSKKLKRSSHSSHSKRK